MEQTFQKWTRYGKKEDGKKSATQEAEKISRKARKDMQMPIQLLCEKLE